MKLLVWLILVLGQIFLFKSNLLHFLEGTSLLLHNWLMGIIRSHPSDLNWLYGAILFGEDSGLRQKPEISAFMVLGIYHIIVVSGSHLTLLQKIIEKPLIIFPKDFRTFLSVILLGIFTMANEWQAACLRAYLGWILRVFCKNKIINDVDLQTLVTLACLLINPNLAQSLSFQLSCAAALGIALAGSLQLKKSGKYLTPFFCVILTAPLIFNVQPCLSWLIVPVNIIALPVVEVILLPLALVNFFLPFLMFITEPIIRFLFRSLDFIAQFQEPFLCLPQQGSRSWGMIYIVSVYLCWRLFLPYFLRAEFKKSQSHY